MLYLSNLAVLINLDYRVSDPADTTWNYIVRWLSVVVSPHRLKKSVIKNRASLSAKAVRSNAMNIVVKLLLFFVSNAIETSAITDPSTAKVAILNLLYGFGLRIKKGEVVRVVLFRLRTHLFADMIFRCEKRSSLELLLTILCIAKDGHTCFALFLIYARNTIKSQAT